MTLFEFAAAHPFLYLATLVCFVLAVEAFKPFAGMNLLARLRSEKKNKKTDEKTEPEKENSKL